MSVYPSDLLAERALLLTCTLAHLYKSIETAVLDIDICVITLNSLITKKQTTKFLSANFQKMFSPCCIILRVQRLGGK